MKRIKKRILNLINKLNVIHEITFNLRFNNRKQYLEYCLLNRNSLGINKQMYLPNEVIVSLTSHGKRLEEVWLTIESLMQQTLKANKIILWLDDNIDINNLPASLILQKERGLEIQIYKPDIKSYKKLIPSLKKFPNSIIITVDDDIIYEFDFIDRLIRSYKNNPNKIHATRTHVITFDDKGLINPYNQWNYCSSLTDKITNLFFTGVGGVLYPPNSLDSEVFDEETFKRICPTADDVWFNAMALKKGTEICKVYTKDNKGEDFIVNPSVQDIGLFNINTLGSMQNDIQIKEVYEKYNLLDLL